MKRYILIFFLIFFTNLAFGQSEQEKLTWCKIHKNKSVKKLDSNFVYIRGFEICGLDCGCRKPPPEYKLILQAGVEYEIRISNWRGNICAVLKNASKQPIARSFQGRYYDGFKFKCKQTGVYYLQFNTPAPFSHYTMIGGACLGMKRSNNMQQQHVVPVKNQNTKHSGNRNQPRNQKTATNTH